MNPLLYRPPPMPHFSMLQYHGPPQQRRDLQVEEDLASVTLQIQRKRFYVDVKKNRRGIFMKIAEVGIDGRKARILLTLSAAVEIRDKLKDLIEVLDDILKKNEEEEPQELKAEDGHTAPDSKNQDGTVTDELIKSHIVNYPYRRYFLDLKKNRRGHFLRLTMLSTLSRIQLAVPSQGMNDLYNAISDLLDKWWDGSKVEEQKAVNLPESKVLRVDNKTIYFDSSFNRFGTYLRISEVRTSSRTAITIPSRSLSRFRDIINGLAEDLNNTKVSKENDETPAPTEKDENENPPAANGDIP
ncbi:Transcriptional activator protein Pur-alpha [Fasciola gigantica]|uniref:Transcriptional activator protein Pur-alpha n=1 Tax=Fasciola gigantica TaxID=46835 RepID=A0A504YAS0_FASGI|nr:Transcriptional activator protein Pur-alpha [Fasciola gigantica]